MKGFFDRKQTQLVGRGEGGTHSCVSCGLYQHVLSPKIPPYGKGKLGLMVIGEAPGADEDRRGRPWQGKMGRFMQQTYKRLGIDLFEDAICLNAVNCRPTDNKGANRPPTPWEIACCRLKVFPSIQRYQPKIIIAHGEAALTSLIGHRWKEGLGGISKWRGWTIPDRELDAWICPTFTPEFVAQKEADGDGEIPVIWQKDIKRAISLIDKPVPKYPDEHTQVEIVEGERAIQKLLKQLILQERLLAFDIETTGLKPYNTEISKIACISVCNSEDKAFVFPTPEDDRTMALLKELFESRRFGKIAANMKFEHIWLQVLWGIEVQPWSWDTVLAAHILDNRPGITGLKFQAYVNFGLMGYENEIAPYLKSEDSNTPNRVMELMADRKWRERLMIYCGIDSLVTRRLAIKQMREVD